MDKSALIACCNICLLAERLKDCESCPFNPGRMQLKPDEIRLVQKTELLKPIKAYEVKK